MKKETNQRSGTGIPARDLSAPIPDPLVIDAFAEISQLLNVPPFTILWSDHDAEKFTSIPNLEYVATIQPEAV